MIPRYLFLLLLAAPGLLLPGATAAAERGPNVVELRQAVSQNPQDPEANYRLGMKYLELGRPQQAARYLKEAVRLKPDYPEALEGLARLNREQGNYGGSAQDLGKLLRLQPKNQELPDRVSNAYNKQGLALLKEGNFAEAEAAFKEAAKADPKAIGPLSNLGVAYFRAGHPAEAAAVFREAARQDPNNAEARFNLGLTLVAQGSMAAAYAVSLDLWPLNPELSAQLSTLARPPRTPYPYAPPAK
jgi:Flp pilus assembly protein TadD